MVVVFASVARAAGLETTLAPYEQGWPEALKTLTLDESRDYVVLVQVPPGAPLDVRSSETVRQTLGKRVFRGNKIGHVAVAWQCHGRRGMAGQTGESSRQALFMALTGWGMTPLLTTYTDGRMQMRDAMRRKHARILQRGNGNVIALEISSAACDRMRDFLHRYVTHPNEPWRKFGLLYDPWKFEGGGCVTFGLAVAEQAGLFKGMRRVFTRTTTIYDGVLGRRTKAPQNSVPYTGIAASKDEEVVVPFNHMLRTPQTGRAVIETIKLIDPELIFAAFAGVRDAAGANNDWHTARLLKTGDGTVERAYAAGRKWAQQFGTLEVVDPEGLSAIVINR